jgi:hypothetical protein
MMGRGMTGNEWILLAGKNVLVFSIRWVLELDVKLT